MNNFVDPLCVPVYLVFGRDAWLPKLCNPLGPNPGCLVQFGPEPGGPRGRTWQMGVDYLPGVGKQIFKCGYLLSLSSGSEQL